jgi:N-acetylglucosamine malate deacetylase 1
MKHILCLHAHPDDAEILCGGTLARLAALGHQVTIASMTAGDCGSDVHSSVEIARIRTEEAGQAARRIGAEHHALGFLDLGIFVDDDARRRVTAALRRFRADIILTASPRDYHCDHEATSILVRDACFGASAPNYDTSQFDPATALSAIPHLYFVDPIEGVDRDGRPVLPHILVDVTSEMETKRTMLADHASQRDWLKRQHGIDDYLDQMAKWSHARGRLAGYEFGEGFRQYKGHPWPATPLLEDLLGSGYRRLAASASHSE